MDQVQKQKLIRWMVNTCFIIFCIFTILFFFLLFCEKKTLIHQNLTFMVFFFFLVSIILDILTLILMRRLPIVPEIDQSIMINVSTKNLKEKMEGVLIDNHYLKVTEYHVYPYSILYTYRKKKSLIHLVIMLDMQILDAEMDVNFEEQIFMKLKQHLRKKNIYKKKDKLYVTFMTFVEQYNDYFCHYIKHNFEKDIGKFMVSVEICNDQNRVYIGNQPSNYVDRYYKKIRKEMKSYFMKF